MTISASRDWSWKPDKVVRTAIKRGIAKCDPLRETKKKKSEERKLIKSMEMQAKSCG